MGNETFYGDGLTKKTRARFAQLKKRDLRLEEDN